MRTGLLEAEVIRAAHLPGFGPPAKWITEELDRQLMAWIQPMVLSGRPCRVQVFNPKGEGRGAFLEPVRYWRCALVLLEIAEDAQVGECVVITSLPAPSREDTWHLPIFHTAPNAAQPLTVRTFKRRKVAVPDYPDRLPEVVTFWERTE